MRVVDCNPLNLRRSCLHWGMDCSTLVFYHCDLGPSNILVDKANGSIGDHVLGKRLGLYPWDRLEPSFASPAA